MMKDTIRILLSSLLFTVYLSPAVPDWVTSHGTSASYPERTYLTGYGIALFTSVTDRDRAAEIAIGNARRDLVERVRVSIRSAVTTRTEENDNGISSTFASSTRSTAELDVQGLSTVTYVDEQNSMVHAFTSVRREDVKSAYLQKLSALQKEIELRMNSARQGATERPTEALGVYLGCIPLTREGDDARSILSALVWDGATPGMEETMRLSDATSLRLRNAIDSLIHRPVRSVEDLAGYLAYQIRMQLMAVTGDMVKETERSMQVLPFTVENTRMGSSFSRYFQPMLEQQVASIPSWSVQQQAASCILTGSYWQRADRYQFIVTVRRVTDGRIIAGADVSVPASVITAVKKQTTPENMRQALIDQRVFAAGETAGSGLVIEAWTNRAAIGDLFVAGERMTLTVRVNLPSYIRCIYHMADGSRVLLVKEYFLDASKVNLAYQIPQEFECAPPFGSEVLQVIARTEPFDPVQTRTEDGYEFLTDDLKSFVVKTRGFKSVKTTGMQSETRVTITTMKE